MRINKRKKLGYTRSRLRKPKVRFELIDISTAATLSNKIIITSKTGPQAPVIKSLSEFLNE